MFTPEAFLSIRFAVREATAFIGHSFADADKSIIDSLTKFFTKLGIRCDSGLRPEPRPVSDKVNDRIKSAELFIGVFTRKSKNADGTYSTSTWVIEEKAAAIAAGKKLLLFVEEGVNDFGGLQGDYEYVRFNRKKFGDALIHAMDYVMSITAVPFQPRVEAPGNINIQIGATRNVDEQVTELRAYLTRSPGDLRASLTLAKLLYEHKNDPHGAIGLLKPLADRHASLHEIHHELAHALAAAGDRSAAILSFQRALDLNSSEFKNYRCYGRCLSEHAKQLGDVVVRRSTFLKAKRLLEQASIVGGSQYQQMIQGDLFVVGESLRDLEVGQSPADSTLSNSDC